MLFIAAAMTEKRRYTVSLPDHVADAVESHAKPLGSTPTEYAGDVIRWWYGQGCPAVTHDEAALRRIKPVSLDINVWALDPKDVFNITGDATVQKLLNQLGLPNLFAQAAEHDVARFMVGFDNHPTHWVILDIFKGSDLKDGNGLMFRAYPKVSTSREQISHQLQAEAKKMGAKGSFSFSQIPLLDKKQSSNQTATKKAGVS